MFFRVSTPSISNSARDLPAPVGMEPRELSGQKNPRLGLPSLGYVPRPSKLGLREIEAAPECPEDGNIGGLEALLLVPLLGVDMWLYPNSAETMKQRRINRQPDMQQSASFNHSI